ncbi:PTS transporter subunit EIIC [Arthrobacter alpinus]|nr:PTS transporter subunit EIIC [Arthrobacter alpinus]
MASVNYRTLAADILEGVGGEKNIATATHCATRLRLTLRDDAQANTAAVEKLPGVITVMKAGGQYQVVIGNDVPTVFAELGKISRFGTDTDAEEEAGPKGNIFNRFIQMVSAIFSPILWPLAGAGLFKAFLALASNLGWLAPTSQTFVVLSAAADALFYFLPLFLAITAAKRFKANQFTAMAIAGALVYPLSIVALNDAGAPVHFAGIPLVIMNYTSSVIPILVAVWLLGYLERILAKVLHSSIRNFMVPLLSIAIMVPLTLLTVGPVTVLLANGVSGGITALFGYAPWLAGAIMGGFWQVFVVFGLHWGLIPVMINDLATTGFSVMMAPWFPPFWPSPPPCWRSPSAPSAPSAVKLPSRSVLRILCWRHRTRHLRREPAAEKAVLLRHCGRRHWRCNCRHRWQRVQRVRLPLAACASGLHRNWQLHPLAHRNGRGHRHRLPAHLLLRPSRDP